MISNEQINKLGGGLTAAILACNPGGMGVDTPGFLPSKPVNALRVVFGAEGAILFAKGVGPGLRCWIASGSGFGFGSESDIWGLVLGEKVGIRMQLCMD